VSSALAIASTYPLWAALKGTLIDGERFGPGRALGTLLCVGGVAAIIKTGRAAAEPEQPGDGRALGVPLALATSVLWAGNTIGIKAGSVGLPFYTVNAMRYGFALAILGGLVLLGRAPGATRPARGWARLVPAIVIDCLVGSACFIYGLTHTDLAVGATLSSLAPLLALPFAVWLGAERLTFAKLAAVIVTVGGIVLLASS
jgi:drug/metabolite transporter (DMT)-like permease